VLDIDAAREAALRLAVQLHAAFPAPGPFGERLPTQVIDTAGEFAEWLLARPHRLRLIPAPFTFAQPAYPGPAVLTQTGDHGMSVTMTDAQEVTYSCEPEDSKNFPVADTLTWSSDDGGAVLTVTPSADGTSCLFAAVAPGSATISVTDGTLSASDLITVTPGGVASLVLTPGTPTGE
jgi:Bacterial Ig-like domain (group 2)